MRNDDLISFSRRTGREELSLIRQAIHKRWGLSATTIRDTCGPLLGRMLKGNDRQRAAALRLVAVLDAQACEELRATTAYDQLNILRDLQDKAETCRSELDALAVDRRQLLNGDGASP